MLEYIFNHCCSLLFLQTSCTGGDKLPTPSPSQTPPWIASASLLHSTSPLHFVYCNTISRINNLHKRCETMQVGCRIFCLLKRANIEILGVVMSKQSHHHIRVR